MIYWFDIIESQQTLTYDVDRAVYTYRRKKYTVVKGDRYELWQYYLRDHSLPRWAIAKVSDVTRVMDIISVVEFISTDTTEHGVVDYFEREYG